MPAAASSFPKVKPMTALESAMVDVTAGLRETGGKNRSPRIDAINRNVGNPLGSPYCAAGVSDAFRRAGAGRTDFPFSGSSQAIKRWFESHGLLSHDAQDLKHWRGALAGWTDADGAHGHIFLVGQRFTDDSGHITSIGTAEYNTGPDGGRDGDGAYSKHRIVPIDRGHKLWFLNCSNIPGGAWWKESA